jgi:2,3-bisphosphoglycerate-dependent phosphoglycerate mutase
MAATRVFLLRHAESANPLVFHGAESDIQLSPRGYRQAESIALELATYAPNFVISSAMRRARETAAPIARVCGVPHLLEPHLHERRVGELCGASTQENAGVWPETLRRWLSGETAYAPAGAESFDAIRTRVLPIWERLAREHAGRTLVVVAHGIICRVLLLSLLPGYSIADWSRITTPNVGISELLHRNGMWHAKRISELSEAIRAL